MNQDQSQKVKEVAPKVPEVATVTALGDLWSEFKMNPVDSKALRFPATVAAAAAAAVPALKGCVEKPAVAARIHRRPPSASKAWNALKAWKRVHKI
jgi:hypothetical protein